MRGRRRAPTRAADALIDGGPIPAGPVDDPDALRAAIELRAARPAADLPSAEFLARLGRELTAESEPEEARQLSRRALLTGAGAAAVAAGVVGAVVDRTVLAPSTAPKTQAALTPDRGQWVPVALASDLNGGSPKRFATKTMTGFVSERNGQLIAVSGACTHLGCLLAPDPNATRLDCPCHRTSFGLDGNVVFSQLESAPAPLPRIQVRHRGGNVEALLPPDA